jgi:hypothetical protein
MARAMAGFGDLAMTRRTMIDFGTDTALITAAFFVRNAVVLIGLVLAMLITFMR